MALWDDLSRKASAISDRAVKQTKILSETARLNMLISDEEKRINSFYFQIGKLYVSLHPKDCESCFESMIEAIVGSEQKIKEYRVQIQEVKGVVQCEKCGAEVAKGAAFCSSCGTPTPKVEIADLSARERCVNCGTMVEKGMRFCTCCGKPIIRPDIVNGIQEEKPAA